MKVVVVLVVVEEEEEEEEGGGGDQIAHTHAKRLNFFVWDP
jgi:hypothetical protein